MQDIVARNNVTRFGSGSRPIVFAHGFGCDQNMWRFITPAFQDEHEVVLFDYVGSGKSNVSCYDPGRYSSLDGYAQDLLDVVEALDLRDVVLVGHSVSGMIGILAAIREPERFSRLVLVGPSPCYLNDSEYVGGFERHEIEALLEMMDKNYIGWASFLAPAIVKNPDRPELAAELETSFCSTDPVIARQFARAAFLSDNRGDLGKLKTPSLIMQCSEDIIAPTSVGEYMHRHLASSTLALMKATGHCPHISHPDETIEVIQQYLR